MKETIQELLIASGNRGKIREFEKILEPLHITTRSLAEFTNFPDTPETGATFHENALLKAKAAYEYTGIISLADDTGLEVEALDGRPGIYSARYAGKQSNDEKNVARLLHEMTGVTNRSAQFKTVLAFFPYQGEPVFFEGICKGRITQSRIGKGGFGYDPIFQPDGYDTTFGSMTPEEKNRISHRGKAIQKFAKWIGSADSSDE